MAEGTRRRRNMAANNSWTECEMWAQVFLLSVLTQNQRKTVPILIDSGHSVRLGFTKWLK